LQVNEILLKNISTNNLISY